MGYGSSCRCSMRCGICGQPDPCPRCVPESSWQTDPLLPVTWSNGSGSSELSRSDTHRLLPTMISGALADDPGVEILRTLIGEFRAGRISRAMRFTMTLLLGHLGSKATRDLLSDYQGSCFPDIFTSGEADRFAVYLRGRLAAMPRALPRRGLGLRARIDPKRTLRRIEPNRMGRGPGGASRRASRRPAPIPGAHPALRHGHRCGPMSTRRAGGFDHWIAGPAPTTAKKVPCPSGARLLGYSADHSHPRRRSSGECGHSPRAQVATRCKTGPDERRPKQRPGIEPGLSHNSAEETH